MAYIVMAYRVMGPNFAVAYKVNSCIATAAIFVAHIAMACIVMAYIAMAYILMAYILMARMHPRRSEGSSRNSTRS